MNRTQSCCVRLFQTRDTARHPTVNCDMLFPHVTIIPSHPGCVKLEQGLLSHTRHAIKCELSASLVRNSTSQVVSQSQTVGHESHEFLHKHEESQRVSDKSVLHSSLFLIMTIEYDSVTDESHVFQRVEYCGAQDEALRAHVHVTSARFLGRRPSSTLRGLVRARFLGLHLDEGRHDGMCKAGVCAVRPSGGACFFVAVVPIIEFS